MEGRSEVDRGGVGEGDRGEGEVLLSDRQNVGPPYRLGNSHSVHTYTESFPLFHQNGVGVRTSHRQRRRGAILVFALPEDYLLVDLSQSSSR